MMFVGLSRWAHRMRRFFFERRALQDQIESLELEVALLERRLRFRGIGARAALRSWAIASGKPVSAVIDDNFSRDKTDTSLYWRQVREELVKCMEERPF